MSNCSYIPQVNGKDSILYKDLVKKLGEEQAIQAYLVITDMNTSALEKDVNGEPLMEEIEALMKPLSQANAEQKLKDKAERIAELEREHVFHWNEKGNYARKKYPKQTDYAMAAAKAKRVRKLIPDNYKVRIGEAVGEKGDQYRDYVSLFIEEVNVTDDLIDNSDKIFDKAAKIKVDKLEKERRENNKTINELQDSFEEGDEKALLKMVELQKRNDTITGLINRVKSVGNVTTVEKVLDQWTVDQELLQDILGKNTISASDISKARFMVNQWSAVSELSGDNDVFTEEELQDEDVRENLKNIQRDLIDYEEKVKQIEHSLLESFSTKVLGRDITFDDIKKPRKDMGMIPSWVLNSGHANHPLVQAVFKHINKANTQAKLDSRDKLDELDRLLNEAKKSSGKSSKEIFEMFREKWSDGSYTSDMVYIYTPEFAQEYNAYFKRLKHTVNTMPSLTDRKDMKKLHGQWLKNLLPWHRENLITLDVNILFPDEGDLPSEYIKTVEGKQSRKEYIQSLYKELGKERVDYLIAKQSAKIKKFKRARKNKYESLLNDEGELGSNEAIFQTWLSQYSPYKFVDDVLNKNVTTGEKGIPRLSFNVVSAKGKGHYSKTYAEIQQNKELAALHEAYLQVNREARKLHHQGTWLHENSLLGMESTMMDKLASDPAGLITYSALNESLKRAFRQSESPDDPTTDLKTKREVKFLQAGIFRDKYQKIDNIYYGKLAAYNKKNAKKADAQIKLKLRKEAANEYAANQSFDIHRIMKASLATSYTLHHREQIQDSVKLAENFMLNEYQGLGTSKTGGLLKKGTEGSASNLLRNFEFFTNTELYGYPSRDKKQFMTSKKLLTKDEKQREADLKIAIEELNKKIEEDPDNGEFKERLKDLQDELEFLGGKFSFAKVLDNVLKYIHLKGLGWNPFSGVANIGFGTVSNYVEGASGQSYTNKELSKAYWKAKASIAKSSVFLKFVKTEDAQKISSLMKRFDILNVSMNELYERGYKSTFAKNMEAFDPYNMITRAEYLNQAPVMIAIMMHQNAVDKDGNKISLWEAYGEDGKLKEGYELEQKGGEGDLILHIQDVIQRNHGDYTHLQNIKYGVLGRALVQFRSWMFEGFNNRFGQEMPNEARGYNFKGRYVTYKDLFKNEAGEYDWNTGMKNTLFSLKQLLTFGLSKGKFEDIGLNETDAANMRKNLMELYILTGLATLGLIIRYAADLDDEDEEGLGEYALNFLVNQSVRVRTDILFYTQPSEFERLNSNIFPAFKLMQDAREWMDAVSRLWDDRPLEVQSGPLEGMNWIFRETLEGLPLTSSTLNNWKKVKSTLD